MASCDFVVWRIDGIRGRRLTESPLCDVGALLPVGQNVWTWPGRWLSLLRCVARRDQRRGAS